ncbi:hypothetical protein N431DRAFT_469047 [Stipitochalara longipes BDJ]|nr:hypothetical protein N431DRAFT_469047 [Stipitochalara longipes BDJ]
MAPNILITGAAGYIGGSLLAGFISHTNGPIIKSNISAILDLSNETAVKDAVLGNNIDIVIHAASSMDSGLASHLIKALGQRRKNSGVETYFIHSSVAAIFSAEGGWPHGKVKDTDSILEKEKQIGGYPNPTNILVTEQAKAQQVTSFNAVVPNVYGTGSGEWRKISVAIPANIRSGIKHKVVFKFDRSGSPPAVHISDLVALYTLLVQKILQKEPIPSGEKGYYFAIAHRAPWWDVLERLAEALHARGLW